MMQDAQATDDIGGQVMTGPIVTGAAELFAEATATPAAVPNVPAEPPTTSPAKLAKPKRLSELDRLRLELEQAHKDRLMAEHAMFQAQTALLQLQTMRFEQDRHQQNKKSKEFMGELAVSYDYDPKTEQVVLDTGDIVPKTPTGRP